MRTAPTVVCLILLNLFICLPAVDNGFSLDDFNWLERARFAPSALEFVTTAEPGQVLNPLPRVLVLLGLRAFGESPLGYHLVLLALHLTAVLLVFGLGAVLAGDTTIGAGAAVLFSVQTSGHEAFFWLSAFGHVLVALEALLMLLTATAYLDSGRKRWLLATLTASAAGLATKATFFPVVFLPLLLPGARPRRLRLGLLSIGLFAAAAAFNLGFSGGGSYLVERGYYRPGIHMAGNLAEYLGRMLLPFDELARRIGDPGLVPALWRPLGWILLSLLIVAAIRGTRVLRLFSGLILLPLLPVLPLVFDPVSRYTYLPAAGLALLVARPAVEVTHRRPAVLCLAAAVGLAAVADIRLRDNRYEYRERQMAGWVADVLRVLPPPPPPVVRISGLPTLAIDPGIHLEAALRLAYNTGDLRLEVLPPGDPPPPGALRFFNGHIVAGNTTFPHSSPGEVPGNDVPHVEQVDPEKGQGGNHNADGELPSQGRGQSRSVKGRAAGRQQEEVSSLGLEIEQAVSCEGDQKEEMSAQQPDEDPVIMFPDPGRHRRPQSTKKTGRHGRGEAEVNRQGTGIGQHFHPTEDAPPTLETQRNEGPKTGSTAEAQPGPGLDESQGAGSEAQWIGDAMSQDVEEEPWSGNRQRGPDGNTQRPSASGGPALDDPQPAGIEGNRQDETRFHQRTEADHHTDGERTPPASQENKQDGAGQLDGGIVARRDGHEAAHRVEGKEESGARRRQAIFRTEGLDEECRQDDDAAGHREIEHPDCSELAEDPVEKCGQDIEQRGLVLLVSAARDLRARQVGALEVPGSETLKITGLPAAGTDFESFPLPGERANDGDMGWLVGPVKRWHRAQIGQGHDGMDGDRDRHPEVPPEDSAHVRG